MKLLRRTVCGQCLTSRPKWKPAADSPHYAIEMLNFHRIGFGSLLEQCDTALALPHVTEMSTRRVRTLRGALDDMTKLEGSLVDWYRDYSAYPGANLETHSNNAVPDSTGGNTHEYLHYWGLRLAISMNIVNVCRKLALRDVNGQPDTNSDGGRTSSTHSRQGLSASYVAKLSGMFSQLLLCSTQYGTLTYLALTATHSAAKRAQFAKNVVKYAAHTSETSVGQEMMLSTFLSLPSAVVELGIYDDMVSILHVLSTCREPKVADGETAGIRI